MTIIITTIIIGFLFCSGNANIAETECGEWTVYNGEKCLKIFDALQSYSDAERTCSQYNSTLVQITSVDEQRFFENYLFTAQKVVENVWTSLRYANSKYKWFNELVANYTNWSEGSPKYNSEFCVQIDSDEVLLGKWTDITCTKRNLALCQKVPIISTQQLLSMFISARKQFDATISHQNLIIDEITKELENTKSQQRNTSLVIEIMKKEFTAQQLNASLVIENMKKEFTSSLQNTHNLFQTTSNSLEKTNRQFDYFFSNKWINYKTFVENNTRKALIYPFRTQSRVLRSEALNLCHQNNATLVDIESLEKQKIVESFLSQINTRLEYNYRDFWIGGSSDSGKYKWLNSGNELSYTNWAAGHPNTNNPYLYMVSLYGDEFDGKWMSTAVTIMFNVFCEISFNA